MATNGDAMAAPVVGVCRVGRTWRSPARTAHNARTPAHMTRSSAVRRTGNNHEHPTAATSRGKPNQHRAVSHHAEYRRGSRRVLASPASTAPAPMSPPSKSNGSFSGSSRRVAGRPAASFSFNGSGFAPACTRRPPRFVPSFAIRATFLDCSLPCVRVAIETWPGQKRKQNS